MTAQAVNNWPITPRLHEYFDLVGLDPRGVGLSTPVQCDPETLERQVVRSSPRTRQHTTRWSRFNKAFGAICLEKSGPLTGLP
jgi:pimeloyl-ACP methyl ester carboxylesterase